MHLRNPAAERRVALHLADEIGQEQHLSVAGAGQQRILRIAAMADDTEHADVRGGKHG